jgi:hypothetical protein
VRKFFELYNAEWLIEKNGYAARAKRGSLGSKPAWRGFAHGCLRGFGMRQNGN